MEDSWKVGTGVLEEKVRDRLHDLVHSMSPLIVVHHLFSLCSLFPRNGLSQR